MPAKFTGTFEKIQEKLKEIGGQWENDTHPNKKVLRRDGGVLNWYVTTGTLQFQGKSTPCKQLEKEVLKKLYPEEYPIELGPTEQPSDDDTTSNVLNIQSSDEIASQYLASKPIESELLIGIVSAVGAESKRVIDSLENRIKGFGYDVKVIKVSGILPEYTGDSSSEYDRIKHLMNEGDRLRENDGNAILAAGVSQQIRDDRDSGKPKRAFIIDSLKHPDEVDFLRKVYGNGFYLLGIHADEKKRHSYLTDEKSCQQTQADDLIKIDEDEKVPHGQRTRDTFHLADLFVNLGKNDDQVKNTIQRFLELIFSNPQKNPTFDEFAMFMAFNSSVRSSDLSRQVGAVITKERQIVATGANDCPQSGGGQYFSEVDPETGEVTETPDGKDKERGEDSNKIAQNEIINEILSDVEKKSIIDKDKKTELEELLKNSKISDLTEFGRVVHAEMEAILSCSRVGITTVGSTLYCTTFPCHNCAKHIIDAGVKRVVYVEPYPKSRALDYHSESVELKTKLEEHNESSNKSVTFEPFTGVGARRFLDLFSMSLGSGIKLKRKDKGGNAIEWSKDDATIRTPLVPKSYLDIEEAAGNIWERKGDNS